MFELNTIYGESCLVTASRIPTGLIDCVVTDPPYPNSANHFLDGIPAAIEFLQTFKCNRWFVFWDEMTLPPVPLPLVAKHIWHRTNTNRPDNYEMIYEFNVDGMKRASRVFPFPVIYLGLTGCIEATGHPTQKNLRMIRAMLKKCSVTGTVFDPFMGSGTTAIACHLEQRNWIGSEISQEYCDLANKRLEPYLAQESLF